MAGALLDGIPEAVVLGASAFGGISMVVITGFFFANLPQGLSGASGRKDTGRSSAYALGVWGGAGLLLVLVPLLSYFLLQGRSPVVTAIALSVAAGAALGVTAETMLPEAVHGAPSFIGLIAGIGFIGVFMFAQGL